MNASIASLKRYMCQEFITYNKVNFQLQLYLKNTLQYRAKRTGPQIALANLGGTVTLEDYNENK